MMKSFYVSAAVFVAASALILGNGQFAFADISKQDNSVNCPSYDALNVFDDGSYYDAIWTSSNITWSFHENSLPNIGDPGGTSGAKVSRRPSKVEAAIIEGAFENWDRALDSRTLQYTSSPNADIKVGFIEGRSHQYFFYYSTRTQAPPKGKLYNGVLGFNSLDTGILNEGYFSALAHRSVANILGMGFISSANPNITVMKGDTQDLYDTYRGGSLKNEGYRYVPSEFEVGLIRSLYGESTCSSTFGKKFDEEREKQAKKLADLELARKVFEEAKARAEAEARAKEEAQVVAKANAAIDAANQAAAAAEAKAAAELKAKQEAEAKAAAELKAKQEAEAAAEAKAAAAKKKKTITCVKGKKVKKVTAVKPKCPKGYKKK